MYRLRIKANYHDIETFINADIDFKVFHTSLAEIINYFNFIHEAYILKTIGETAYKDILLGFNKDMTKDFALKRYKTILANG